MIDIFKTPTRMTLAMLTLLGAVILGLGAAVDRLQNEARGRDVALRALEKSTADLNVAVRHLDEALDRLHARMDAGAP